jgi:environmental stress-induced protein Ves
VPVVTNEPEVVRPDDASPQPWANGLGVTRVLAERPAWRVSIAEIHGRMPFSTLPGFDRILIPLTEERLDLTIDGAPVRALRTRGVAFSGEARVTASTGEKPIEVLNVMVRRHLARASWAVDRVDDEIPVPGGATLTALVAGEALLDGVPLPVGSVLFRSSRARRLHCRAALVARVQVSPVPS